MSYHRIVYQLSADTCLQSQDNVFSFNDLPIIQLSNHVTLSSVYMVSYCTTLKSCNIIFSLHGQPLFISQIMEHESWSAHYTFFWSWNIFFSFCVQPIIHIQLWNIVFSLNGQLIIYLFNHEMLSSVWIFCPSYISLSLKYWGQNHYLINLSLFIM